MVGRTWQETLPPNSKIPTTRQLFHTPNKEITKIPPVGKFFSPARRNISASRCLLQECKSATWPNLGGIRRISPPGVEFLHYRAANSPLKNHHPDCRRRLQLPNFAGFCSIIGVWRRLLQMFQQAADYPHGAEMRPSIGTSSRKIIRTRLNTTTAAGRKSSIAACVETISNARTKGGDPWSGL